MFKRILPLVVFDMVKSVYRDKPLILSGLRFWRRSSPIYHETFIKAGSNTVFDMIDAVYPNKPLIFIGLRSGRGSSPIIRQ